LIAADQLADGDLTRGHNSIEGSRDRRVAEIDLGTLGIDLGLQDVGARCVSIGARTIEIGLRGHILSLQLLLAGELGFRVDQGGFGAFLRRLGLLELDLVGLRLDDEQRRSLLQGGAVLIFDLLQVSLHSRHQLDRVHRRGIAGRLKIQRDPSAARARPR
jgi:hypothetical protein